MTRLRSWLRWLTAAGLGIDVYVHWHLAPRFDTLKSSVSPHVSQGQLFRIEAVLALLAMVLVLLVRWRSAAAFASLVAAAGWWRCCCIGTWTWGQSARCQTCTTPPGTLKRLSAR